MNIQLLLTGDEILSGDILDTNSQFLAQALNNIGINITKKTTIGDNLSQLISQLTQLSNEADILIVNGGLGPTVDDLTAQALASAANVELEFHQQALEHLNNWCQQRGISLSNANKKQAYLPKGCNIIANPIGSAVGFHLILNECNIFCTPGVPSELKKMFNEYILPSIEHNSSDVAKATTEKWQVFGIGESNIQQLITDKFPNWPPEIELGFRASMPAIEVKLTSTLAKNSPLRTKWRNKITNLLGAHIISDGNKSLAEVVVEQLRHQYKKVTFAESCTGGLIASMLTQVPGSSEVFEAGFVSYSNKMKSQLLGVSEKTLEQYGAVSQQTVEQMLAGALSRSSADIGVAVSGIAGPTGGTKTKPVGTVWLAWGSMNKVQTCCLHIPASRTVFQKYVAYCALDLIRRTLLNIVEPSQYLLQRAAKQN